MASRASLLPPLVGCTAFVVCRFVPVWPVTYAMPRSSRATSRAMLSVVPPRWLLKTSGCCVLGSSRSTQAVDTLPPGFDGCGAGCRPPVGKSDP
jgi:hypothetical protein